ncbi:MAG: SpoIVB peptidase [Clostridia bacterium]|nr:SpoIVB peptidase [Clostridia bacterium]
MKLLKQLSSCGALLLLLSLLLIAGVARVADAYIPSAVSVFRGEEPSVPAGITLCPEGEGESRGAVTTQTATARLFGVLPVKRVKIQSYEARELCPGGGVFGLRIRLGGAMVTSLTAVGGQDGREHRPGREAGLLCGDLITAVDGARITTAEELSRAVAASEGRALSLTVKRGERTQTLSLTPVFSVAAGAYRAGLFVKDQAAGIGTVTFIDPETGAFGGLGHGVYDSETAALLPIERGAVTGVALSGVVAGVPGTPGELRGHLTDEKTGTLLSNTDCGVFGILAAEAPASEPIPIGLSSSVHVGAASIRCTLSDGVCEEYGIEITEIRKDGGSTKSFCIRVTDARLLERTGGIVQGMSGSPILQDGKLIGAVTHVMISDPTAGYGIFIENMLSVAEEARRAA